MLAYVSTLSPSVRNKAQNMGGMGRDQRLLTFSLSTLVLAGEEEELAYLVAVSYTHLTLPTNAEV